MINFNCPLTRADIDSRKESVKTFANYKCQLAVECGLEPHPYTPSDQTADIIDSLESVRRIVNTSAEDSTTSIKVVHLKHLIEMIDNYAIQGSSNISVDEKSLVDAIEKAKHYLDPDANLGSVGSSLASYILSSLVSSKTQK